jgi:hypothetical protein
MFHWFLINTNLYLNPIEKSMRKSFLFVIVSCFVFFSANSQITQENWMVGGNASFISQKSGAAVSTPQNSTHFTLSPTIGYFILDKMVTGLKVSIESARNAATNISSSTGQTNYSIGPFIRYYLLPTDKQANIFVEGNYQFGIHTASNNGSSLPNTNFNNYSVSAGSAIFFNTSVALEISLGYNATKYQGISGINSSIGAGVGFQIHLKR